MSNTNNTISHWNPLEDDHLDYSDTFSQSYISPLSTTLQQTDDMDYQLSPGKRKAIHSLAMYEESPSDYSLTSLGDTIYDDFGTSPHTASTSTSTKYVSPVDIRQQQRHSMMMPGSKQYNLFMNERNKAQHPQQSMYHPSAHAHALHLGYSSSSVDPGAVSSGFPMSAPANIGYDFHMNGRSPTLSSLGSPSKADLAALPQGHLPMAPQLHHTDVPQQQNLDDDYAMQVNLQAMMEKRRRRRESHNAVERRRRENINDRIHELGCLLPESMLEEITNGSHSPSASPGGPNTATKPNKGAILRKSVDHIRLLQQEVQQYQHRVKKLELVLDQYNGVKQQES